MTTPRATARRRTGGAWAVALCLVLTPRPAAAFFEDLCVNSNGHFENCIIAQSQCLKTTAPDQTCPREVLEALAGAARPRVGRSMVHADATYFLAEALGYRADVAYWIAAYDEVTDLARYAPLDQCGVQASSANSGRDFITAAFNGFERTNVHTDGPLYHYLLAFSPNGDGTDVHGAGGVQAVYPFHYPWPGYPQAIDDIYEGTLYNLRQWAMNPSADPGLLCAAGMTEAHGRSHFSGTRCVEGTPITGTVPLLKGHDFGASIEAHTGPKLLDTKKGPVTYDQLGAWLKDPARTTGKLWQDPAAPPVPVQVARVGIYLHSLQDVASHSTYCGDDAPSPPGGGDSGSYMALGPGGLRLVFGSSCATAPHVLSHVQETATGDVPLPLRDYTALNATLEELVVFGNAVAKRNGWLANPQLLPPDVEGGKNAQGLSAADLEATLIGTVVQGQRWTRGERYQPGAVTAPLRIVDAAERMRAMNAALLTYSETTRQRSAKASGFVPLQLMPGNSADPKDPRACFHSNSAGPR